MLLLHCDLSYLGLRCKRLSSRLAAPPMFRSCVATLFISSLSIAAFSQDSGGEDQNVPERKEIINSLGMKLVELPGTPVFVSIWETRVSDWDAYTKHQGISWTYKPAFVQTTQDPVVNVTFSEAQEFCAWLTAHERKAGVLKGGQSYRLPSKSEWDAASGMAAESNASDSLYPWGDAWPPPRHTGNYGNQPMTEVSDDGYPFTAPVGQFLPSSSGCFDLGGNVWEWTSDHLQGGELDVTLRGGSWMYWRRECLQTQYAYRVPTTTRSPGIGFRCVLEDSAAAERLSLEHKEMASKLMEKPVVEQEEIEEAKRKLIGRRTMDEKEIDEAKREFMKTPTVDQKEVEEARRKLMEGPVIDQKELDEARRSLLRRRQDTEDSQPNGPSLTPSEIPISK